MLRSKLMRILLIAGSALIIVGVSLMVWMMATEDERSAIEVQLSDGLTKEIEFEGLALVPGGEYEYEVILKNENSDTYELTLDFVETEESALKNFARVKILSNGNEVHDDLLVNVFEGEDIVLPVDFTRGENTALKIVYYMPLDVGNEAKNTEAVFKLVLTASNE